MSEKEKKEKSKSFILRVDSETMNAIEAWAADEFRSTNGQIQWILNEALKKSGRLKKKKTANVDDADS
ncbi:MAG: Arc family DNA-binding protein [Bacteroidaceae bacterium]|nr:Arc family DNA-binding protein [Bacteroidaceae bacterium]